MPELPELAGGDGQETRGRERGRVGPPQTSLQLTLPLGRGPERPLRRRRKGRRRHRRVLTAQGGWLEAVTRLPAREQSLHQEARCQPALDHRKKSGQNRIRGQQGRNGGQQVPKFPGSGQTASPWGCSLLCMIQKQREGRDGRLRPATAAGRPNRLPSRLAHSLGHVLRHL